MMPFPLWVVPKARLPWLERHLRRLGDQEDKEMAGIENRG